MKVFEMLRYALNFFELQFEMRVTTKNSEPIEPID